MHDTIGERIKEVRKQNGLTQQAFADKLGLKRNTVGGYEINSVTPSDRTILDICQEFGISEKWLRTGEGDMRIPMSRDEEIADMVGKALSGDNEFKKSVIRMICTRSESELDALEKMLTQLVEDAQKNKDQAGA